MKLFFSSTLDDAELDFNVEATIDLTKD